MPLEPFDYAMDFLSSAGIGRDEVAKRVMRSVGTISRIRSGKEPLQYDFFLAFKREFGDLIPQEALEQLEAVAQKTKSGKENTLNVAPPAKADNLTTVSTVDYLVETNRMLAETQLRLAKHLELVGEAQIKEAEARVLSAKVQQSIADNTSAALLGLNSKASSSEHDLLPPSVLKYMNRMMEAFATELAGEDPSPLLLKIHTHVYGNQPSTAPSDKKKVGDKAHKG